VGLAPRFYDVARHLGAPDDIEPRCLPREELARYYLDQYVRWGGRPIALESFLEDIHLLWMVCKFTMLFFPSHRALDGRVDWTEDRELARQEARRDLYVDLARFLRQVGWDGQA